MDQMRPMEAGKEVKCSKGKRGRREAGQVTMLLRLVAPGGPIKASPLPPAPRVSSWRLGGRDALEDLHETHMATYQAQTKM